MNLEQAGCGQVIPCLILKFENRRPGFFPGNRSASNPSARGWRAHCDAALKRMVSVDHAGKLFERIEAHAPAGHDKRYRNNDTGIPPHSASFCPRHGNHPLQGAVRSAGRVSFVTFLCPPKKSKRKKSINSVWCFLNSEFAIKRQGLTPAFYSQLI